MANIITCIRIVLSAACQEYGIPCYTIDEKFSIEDMVDTILRRK